MHAMFTSGKKVQILIKVPPVSNEVQVHLKIVNTLLNSIKRGGDIVLLCMHAMFTSV
jgi:hypothetical protein